MKTVTIPTCANPLIIYINGKKFTYPAGATVEVPDEVAEVIERHEEAHPKPLPAPDPRSGGFGLPTVELSTIVTDGKITLPDEDASKMDALNGAPCHIKLTYKYDAAIWTVVVYPTVFIAHDIYVYSVRLPLFNRTVSVSKANGSWTVEVIQ